ncbi:hypothetical membrane protein, conserved [Thermococcus onnurineus NA1]|uniref:Hypothetical membrane protein, conserved n=1 Tax=Thermococcus onnurineus (strain NA1) TaxID=523850 RepID=B6YU53_THEON|nr:MULTISPECIES: pro-sigmaK processing inhibitor BofA family protein [Thermococcus]ACJ15995.1 hypothetical membrane protein, conserved [Thermococcus onnurineus NA1]NJD99336.1 hypothetical protein [Thermococcus sp. LS1]NJE42282.1 hypothetical protein [Thermococcus sp. GR6]NJE46493.1 hypothetical protein [Thermococcus sp. GR7]NJE77587.1 hypothetical protein [Thermococcus sp. GR4]
MIETLLFLVLLVVALYLVIKLTVAILKYLVTNAIIGLILLWILNTVGIAHVEYTFLNILIVAIGGIVGVILLVILSWL